MIQLAGGQYCIPSGNPIVREKYAPNRGSAAHFCTTLHRIDMLQRQKTHQTQTFAALQQGINVVFAHKSHATRCKTSCKVVFLAHSPLKKAAIRTGKTRGMLGQPHMLSSTSTQSHQAPTDDYIDTGWLELVGSFESYWHERSKNLRHNLRKQRHKLADQGVHISLREVTAPEDMAAAVARYGALESAGWKAGIGTAVHPDNEQGRFYRQLLEKSARAGEALVCEYWFDDRMVASNLCQLRGDTLVVLKTTYDEGCKHVSPAFLLREAELQSFFETGRIRRLEFYGRLRPWHTHWTEHRRTLYHTTAYRTSWIRQLARLRQASRHDQTATPLTP